MSQSIEHNLFGLGIGEHDFNRMLNESKYKEKLEIIAHRIFFIDLLRYRLKFIVGESYAPVEYEHRLSIEHRALQFHLLCTCIDALSEEDFLGFHEWLEVKKQERKTKYMIDDKLITEVISKIGDDLRDPDTFRYAAYKLYKEAYLPNYGNQKAFLRFFDTLPVPMKLILSQVYTISDLLDENEISRELKVGAILPTDIETWNREREKWKNQCDDEKVRKVAVYIYQYQRNPYTHKAISRKPRITIDWSRILGEKIEDDAWDPIGDIIELDSKYKIVRFKGIPGEDEIMTLRLVVSIGWVKRLGFPIDEDFVKGFRNDLIRRDRMHAALYELERVLDIIKFYTCVYDRNSTFGQMLSLIPFPVESIENLKGFLGKTLLHDETYIDDYLMRLININRQIIEFNTTNVPPFDNVSYSGVKRN